MKLFPESILQQKLQLSGEFVIFDFFEIFFLLPIMILFYFIFL